MSRLLVIGGYATSGKDAVANVLVEELGWYKTYMSKPLEQALLTLNPYIPPAWADGKNDWKRYTDLHAHVGYDESKKNPEVRRLLQTLGTEIGRNMFDENVWLKLVVEEAEDQLENDNKVVVTGIRYPNELKWLKNRGATSLWVDRPGITAVNTHSSDNTLDHTAFDIICPNTGTMVDLKAWVFANFKE